ncbi:MAG: hypothetical protein HY820_39410, partial [Acidobacteria bacterium]|nr:hypothetical protein [Acidobacteriota bacterium]
KIAADAHEPVGVNMEGRGFDVAIAAPFGRSIAEGLSTTARQAAALCPTGAIALRTARSCDMSGCGVANCKPTLTPLSPPLLS